MYKEYGNKHTLEWDLLYKVYEHKMNDDMEVREPTKCSRDKAEWVIGLYEGVHHVARDSYLKHVLLQFPIEVVNRTHTSSMALRSHRQVIFDWPIREVGASQAQATALLALLNPQHLRSLQSSQTTESGQLIHNQVHIAIISTDRLHVF